MKNPNINITLNFATIIENDNQPLAIMPAELAKKLLKQYANRLVLADPREIVIPLIDELQSIINQGRGDNDKVKDAVEACTNFIQERQLIEHCAKENWGAFTVEPEQAPERHPSNA